MSDKAQHIPKLNVKWDEVKTVVRAIGARKRRASFVDMLVEQRAIRSPQKHHKAYTMDNKGTFEVTSRQTKIVCTIGPVTQSVDMLKKLMIAGMNVARLNFSHGTHEYHAKTIANIRQAREEVGCICAILLDTKGPEIRTGGNLITNTIQLKAGQEIILNLTDPEYVGNEKEIYVDYKNLAKVASKGCTIKIDDGLIILTVLETEEGKYVRCLVQNSASLGTRKGINLPNCDVDLPSMTTRDKNDLKFGCDNNLDFVALSFTRCKQDIIDCRNFLNECNPNNNINIIAKIENRQGISNFDEILTETDAVMVARGDLGVEIPLSQVSLKQKMMISKCNFAGKPVITATQMLESMVVHSHPTRAEATDVANAVFDGSDCVMLSGETAKGDNPIESVQVMARICQSAEFALNYKASYMNIKRAAPKPMSKQEALAASAVQVAMDIFVVSAIVVPTVSGDTAVLVAKYRPSIPILAVTGSYQTARRCMLSNNIVPVVVKNMDYSNDELIKTAIQFGAKKHWVVRGDQVVVVHGVQGLATGIMNTLSVETVDDKISDPMIECTDVKTKN